MRSPDFQLIKNPGGSAFSSIFLLQPLTIAATAWMEKNNLEAGDDHLYWGTALMIERRYAPDVLRAIADDGLLVESDEQRKQETA